MQLPRHCLSVVVHACLSLHLVIAGSTAWAQGSSTAAKPTTLASHESVIKAKAAVDPLDWQHLSAPQHQALLPLASTWTQLSDTQKKKWIGLSANFQKLSPTAKARLHERMAQWAALTPRQRTHARLNFSQSQALPQEDRAERWEVYQALTPEQKKALAAAAPKAPLAPQVKVPKPAAQ